MKNYSGSIALTKLQHVVMELDGQNGKVKGLFIPTEQNNLVAGKEGAFYLPVRIIAREEEDKYGQHGFIAQSVDSETYKQMSDEERKALPILGNIKCWDGASQQSDSTGNAGGDQTFTPGKPLPF